VYFKTNLRRNPETNDFIGYYRLVESYRNFENRVCHRTILNVGCVDYLTTEQRNKIQKQLSNRAEGKFDLFIDPDPEVTKHVEIFWSKIVSEKRIDLPETILEKQKSLVDADTIKHKEVREIGSEWMCYQALEQLKLADFFQTLGWNEIQIQLSLTQIISRAVYPASELKTSRWIKENSAICGITNYPNEKITKDKLYKNALALYKEKDRIEQYLSKRTNELFDIEDKIILYDLTNTYFEGEKRNSKLAKFGRSKEKRSDAKLVVLAMVINPEGFLKYSNIFEGNTSDSSTLPTIINSMRLKTSSSAKRAIVVMDAGIATENNLKLLQELGYDYVCVSRSNIKDYSAVEGTLPQIIKTKNDEELTVQAVCSSENTDYYLKIKSPGKQAKETAMKDQAEGRFEEMLNIIKSGISKKNSTKKADKINIRIGRAKQKYPSISKFYNFEVKTDDKDIVIELNWSKNLQQYQNKIENLGVYFVRTNLTMTDENTVWKIYNTIREIDSSFRAIKTDLELRPIYHKKDESTLAHLHLGLLGYWLLNTIRHQLKQKQIKKDWQEIVRIGNTQKLVTTTAQNLNDEQIIMQRCSEPIESIIEIYKALNYKFYPFVKRKFVVHNPELKKSENANYQLTPT
jgi:hypothetical protein